MKREITGPVAAVLIVVVVAVAGYFLWKAAFGYDNPGYKSQLTGVLKTREEGARKHAEEARRIILQRMQRQQQQQTGSVAGTPSGNP